MAPAATAGKPKRKRVRRRRQLSSDESSSSSDDDSSSEEEQQQPPPKKEESSEDESSSEESSSSSSSDESSSDEELRGRRRRGQGGKPNTGLNGDEPSTSKATEPRRRPYPSRSPSPQQQRVYNPANLPLGQSPFPLLRSLGDGPILPGLVPGDEGFVSGLGTSKREEEVDPKREEEENAREERFGAWWRARLVSEFENELGTLAVEPGLTQPRLELLLSSLTSLSTLHTTGSAKSFSSNSIWVHDPSASIDPLATLEGGEGEQWAKAKVGGRGDVEVGEEGVKMDKRNDSNGKGDENGMDVDSDDDSA
ncbi:hypothetical protein T439DRAFT_321949 [Meredithblackwellia eburnea MCA 4105]